MPSLFLLFLWLSDVLYKAANLVWAIHFDRFVLLQRYEAAFSFAALFLLLDLLIFVFQVESCISFFFLLFLPFKRFT